MSEFTDATAVRDEGDGRYGVTLDPGWFIAAGPNGGYLAGVLLQALTARVGDANRPARSLSVNYLASSHAGDAVIETTVLRDGRSLAFVEARLRQDDRLVAHATGIFGNGRAPDSFQDFALPLDLPGPEDIERIDADEPAIAARYHYHPWRPQPLFGGGRSEFWCWLRPRDPSPVDPVLLATHADAMIPAIVFRSRTPVLAPTLQYTVHFRQPASPAYDGWCVGHARTRMASEGFAEEDCDIYDASGRLLAQARQLAMLLPLG